MVLCGNTHEILREIGVFTTIYHMDMHYFPPGYSFNPVRLTIALTVLIVFLVRYMLHTSLEAKKSGAQQSLYPGPSQSGPGQSRDPGSSQSGAQQSRDPGSSQVGVQPSRDPGPSQSLAQQSRIPGPSKVGAKQS